MPSMPDSMSWRLWWQGIRPNTLGMSLVPVFLGTALALHQGARFDLLSFLLAVGCVLCIQAGTNLYNDLGDGEKGSDGPERLGPQRLLGSGLATPAQVRRAARLCFGWALVGGLLLVWQHGLSILLIGLCSLAAGWAYSRGPLPLSHTRFGEACVLLFFGLVAVAGSHFLQAGHVSVPALLYGLVPGLHSAAVLMVNNWRDRHNDCRAGRRTLAGSLDERAALRLYALLLLLPFGLLGGMAVWLQWPALAGWPMLLLPAVPWLLWQFRHRQGRALNLQLKQTAQLQMGLCALQLLALLA